MKLHKTKRDPELYYYFNAKDEKRWMYRHKYYDANGKRKEKKRSGFTTEKEAYKALIDVKASTLRGETKKVNNDNLTVAEWLDRWFEAYKSEWKPSTVVTREHIIRLHIKPAIGHYKLQTLDKNTYRRKFINPMLKKWKVNTVQAYHNIFKIAINAAVDEEILPRNRFKKIVLSSNENDSNIVDNYLTATELVQLLETSKKHATISSYTMIKFLAYTGVRCGEALALQWKDIDFIEKSVDINKTRDQWGTRSPKTKNSNRIVLVDDELITQLKNYKKWCREKKFEYGQKLKDDDFVFITHEMGRPLHSNYITKDFKKMIKLSGVREITIHGLRHTHATILINKNANVKAIAERLGNTPAMIYNVYGHVFKELEETSVQLFSDSLAESKAIGAKSGANS